MAFMIRYISGAFLFVLLACQSTQGGEISRYQEDISTDARIRAELSKRTTAELLKIGYFGSSEICGQQLANPNRFKHCVEQAVLELVSRAQIQELLQALDENNFSDGSVWVADQVLERINSPAVSAGFLRLAKGGKYGPNYFALMHFANRCEGWALSDLTQSGNRFGVSSATYSEALQLVGKCNFKPATKLLVACLSAASLNAVGACLESLERIYPEGPKDAWGDKGSNDWELWLRQRGSWAPDGTLREQEVSPRH